MFDIGMHDGEDTAYYLAQGYEVVAVEANPKFCEAATKRFAAEIADGQLTVRNVGIAEESGELDFWVSEKSDWSSFHRELATRDGKQASRIVVPTLPFAELLGEYRAPLYAKVDIEANDSLCVHELARCEAPPPYFSFEAHTGASADVSTLAELGYCAFKCVSQLDWRGVTPENMHDGSSARGLITRLGGVPAIGPRLRTRAHEAYLRVIARRARAIDGRRFPVGSSGPLARELTGRWLSAEEVIEVWEYRLASMQAMNGGVLEGLAEWFDIHAARVPG